MTQIGLMNLRARSQLLVALFATAMSLTAFVQIATAQEASTSQPAHPGQAIYDKACAACHNNPEATKSPALSTLKGMRYQAIWYALTEGKMQVQAAALSNEEKTTLVEFLAGRETISDDWVAATMCPDNRKTVDLTSAPSVLGFGFDNKNHRHLTAAQTGLTAKDMPALELAWAIGFPKATTMRSQPAVVGNTLFFSASDNSKLMAIDIAGPPCFKWVFTNDIPLRTGVAFGELPGKERRKVVIVADVGSTVHMVDAQTGTLIWRQYVGLYQYSITTGTPLLHKDRVYVPVSQYEITVGADPKHECCKTHGAVTALDASTGKPIWTMHTMEEAKPLRDRGDGQMYFGPSGAPIWNSPSIDEKRGLLFVGTGEATSEPAHANTNSILAIDVKDGSIRWSMQATADDIFLGGCRPGSTNLNCPKAKSVFRDVDFGASMMLITSSQGKDLVIGGQKSGEVWALDRDTGKVVWRQAFGTGSPLGGIHWGLAYDGERIFAPINRPYGQRPPADAAQKPGIHALKADNGDVLWTYVAEPDCSGDRQARVRGCGTNIGFSGAPTVIDGAVLAGSLDGFLRAFDAKTGALLFQFDTAREFETINGVPGKGGSIDNASIVATNGYVFVTSGYGMFGQMPGNVLLAFKPKAKQ